MIKRKGFIVGIDIGGSKINAILFQNSGILRQFKILTPKKNIKKFLDQLEKLINKTMSGLDEREILGIGCGIAGALDLGRGTILNSPNIKILNGFNIKNWLSKKFDCKVKIDNDARCFLRGEYLFGAGKGFKNIVGMTLGTGIGGGIIIDGKTFYGANDSAGELGHMILNVKRQNSSLKTYDLEELTVKQARKNKFSKGATKEFEKNLGIGVANIINILDPEIIIIGGGAAEAAKKFIISPKSRKNVKILRGELGEDAGAIGAAALFYDNQS